ncbi:MAG: hypothetical protein M3Y87_00290 [Myxococcota bacterium]|nr:hypothetical protein [Myxococcota bacterium]
MTILTRTLAATVDELVAFLRDGGRRALHVCADARLREPLLEAISACVSARGDVELHEVSSAIGGDRFWYAAAAEIAAQHVLVHGAASARAAVGRPSSGLAAVATVLSYVCARSRAHGRRLVVVVAPVRATSAEWAIELDLLVQRSAALGVQWIVIEQGVATYAERVAPGDRLDARVPNEVERRELAQRLLREPHADAGLAPAAAGVAVLVRQAAGHFLEGRPIEAVRLQARACAIAEDAREQMELQLVLASFCAAAGDPARGLAIASAARDRAASSGAVETEMTAWVTIAGITLGAAGIERGAGAYIDAARRASALGQLSTALDLFRASGELYQAATREELAASAYREALASAERTAALSRPEASSTRAVALRIAELCGAHGLTREAARFRAVASAMGAAASAQGAPSRE